MFDNNQKILEQWFTKEQYSESSKVIEKMLSINSEQQRVQLLKNNFIHNIHKFEWISLWDEKEEIPGWDDQIKDQHVPAIIFFPAKAADDANKKRGCILIVPGGGYQVEADTTEGWPIIRRLTQEGFHCALLVYRLMPYSRRSSLIDAQRAIRYLRYHADRFNILEDKIGMLGGSAGGNLTCLCGVHFDHGDIKSQDPLEQVSCRPDACISMYGTFSSCSFPGAEDHTEIGDFIAEKSQLPSCIYSFKNIRDAFFYSPEKWVTPDTPPFFLWQTCDEDDPRQMFIFAKALTDAGVRFEVHIYPFGRHGLGLADGIGQPTGRGRDEHVMHWMDQAVEWLKIYKFGN